MRRGEETKARGLPFAARGLGPSASFGDGGGRLGERSIGGGARVLSEPPSWGDAGRTRHYKSFNKH